jgi:Zn-finger nucleic acid-binding protein
MFCPLCGIHLKAVERQGLEMDYCVQCNGLWLDQGELTELVRREALAAIVQGQEVLAEARKNQEFDRRVLDFAPVGANPFVLK